MIQWYTGVGTIVFIVLNKMCFVLKFTHRKSVHLIKPCSHNETTPKTINQCAKPLTTLIYC